MITSQGTPDVRDVLGFTRVIKKRQEVIPKMENGKKVSSARPVIVMYVCIVITIYFFFYFLIHKWYVKSSTTYFKYYSWSISNSSILWTCLKAHIRHSILDPSLSLSVSLFPVFLFAVFFYFFPLFFSNLFTRYFPVFFRDFLIIFVFLLIISLSLPPLYPHVLLI